MPKRDRSTEPARDGWLRRQMQRAGGAGKGDTKRIGDDAAFRANYEAIFGPPKLNVWDESDPDHPRHQKRTCPPECEQGWIDNYHPHNGDHWIPCSICNPDGNKKRVNR